MRLRSPFIILLLFLSAPAFAESPQPLHEDAAANEAAAEVDPEALADLFPNGAPNLLTPGSIATTYRLPPNVQTPADRNKLPTAFDYADGPFRFGVGTSVRTRTQSTPVIPSIPDPNVAGAAGGSGELKGEVRYAGEQWEFYGTRTLAVSQADGAPPAVNERTVLGSSLRLPDWLAGGKIGSSIELLPSDKRMTRFEYRQPLGSAEGFLAAEQTFKRGEFDPAQPPASVRGGVKRRF